MADVKCQFCDGTGETAMGGTCAECGGTGTAKQEDTDAVANPHLNGERNRIQQSQRRHETGYE